MDTLPPEDQPEKRLVKREVSLEPQSSLTSGASLSEVTNRIKLVNEVLKNVMQENVHYGIIPGTGSKPSLLKPGAEKLCALFNLSPEVQIERDDLPNGHREYTITTTLVHYPTGRKVGQGVGSCSTMETRYRYRNVDDYEDTGESVPWDDYKAKKAEYRKQGFGAKKVSGEWKWVKYLHTEGKVENPDIADVYNTCLKIGKKRSVVDAVLSVTGASDIFTQDAEDLGHSDGGDHGDASPVSAPSPEKKSQPRGAQREESSQSGEDDLILGAERWEGVEIADVVEEKTAKGSKFYVVKLADGREAGTLLADLAKQIASWDIANLDVKPGRKNGSWAITKAEKVELE